MTSEVTNDVAMDQREVHQREVLYAKDTKKKGWWCYCDGERMIEYPDEDWCRPTCTTLCKKNGEKTGKKGFGVCYLRAL